MKPRPLKREPGLTDNPRADFTKGLHVSANFSRNAKLILSLAGDEALLAKSPTIAPVHILQGIVRTPECEAMKLLESITTDAASLRAEVLGMSDATSLPTAGQSVLSRAEDEAKAGNRGEVGSAELLLALAQEAMGEVALVLAKYGITSASLGGALASARTPPPVGVSAIMSSAAAEPVGAYAHARRVGNLLFLAGIGPRQRGSKEIPGVRLDSAGNVAGHDIEAQVRSAFENVRLVLEAAGSSWDRIVDVTVFLTDMKRDFATFNRVWAEFFKANPPARTTVEVGALPTPIAFEVKVIATVG